MKKRLFSFLFLFSICLGSLSAQTFSKARVFKKMSLPQETYFTNNLPDTLKILAVMVDFPEDKDAATFGNGKFGTIYSQDKNYGNSILDPLPHDRNYFSLHLEFAKNYYKKVSKGKLNLSYNVLPGIVTVSELMRNYSPAANSDDLTPLGKLSKEVWTLALAQNPGLDYSKYDLFIILHAGVGRDISLPGSLGNERDLPSVYLGDNTLRNIYKSDLTGLPVNRNNKINSMIIPETESRELSNLGVTTLVQITINGLLVANIASHLGLPDLFDTKTGKSAIGRFGLMDGQSIFAYNGVFPPEPSAWEKIFLGWEKPVVTNLEPGKINLTAESVSSGNDTTIFKVPINSSEYFLLENRERDAKKNGSVITYVIGSDTLRKTFYKDTTGYYSFDTDSLKGIITDVDEFDWALPGSGILIWHIDNNIINEKIAVDQINADLNHRGVFLEEADGIQDIGQEFTSIFGDVVVGEGDSTDIWFSTNKTHFYKNRFTPESTPNSNSNSGANSLIYITDFSNKSNKMSFNISFSNEANLNLFIRAKLPVNQKIKDIFALPDLSAGNDDLFFIRLDNQDFYGFDKNGNIKKRKINFSQYKPAVVELNSKLYLVGVNGNSLNVWDYSKDSVSSLHLNEIITTPPVISGEGNINIQIGTDKGRIRSFEYNTNDLVLRQSSIVQSDSTLTIKQIAVDGDYFSAIASVKDVPGSYFLYKPVQSSAEKLPINSEVQNLILSKDNNGRHIAVLASNNGDINVVLDGQIFNTFNIGKGFTSGSMAMGNIKKSGENYIVFNNGNNLEVRSLSGTLAENFPFADPDKAGFDGTPLIADLNNDNNFEILTITKDGRIFAIDAETGKTVRGFPLTIGSSFTANPIYYVSSNTSKSSLGVVSDSSSLYVWNISQNSGKSVWNSEYGNFRNTAFIGAATSENKITSFFPEERVYNYPNPVYGGETFIRYYVSEDSRIDIKIFDLAGDFVAELKGNARGGFDSEIKWEIKNIQSGIYLARVEATGNSGSKGYKIIKIAVVK